LKTPVQINKKQKMHTGPEIEDQSLDPMELALKAKERELNSHLDEEILRAPERMPKAVYYIIPNEFAERFCFYGINPLINPLFKTLLNMGTESAFLHTHLFKFLAYFTPLFGAAISDSFLGKYETIVALSCVYVVGTLLLAIFTAPAMLHYAGVLIGLILIAVGTGGKAN
jgi:dipeptide/tripeptide permease